MSESIESGSENGSRGIDMSHTAVIYVQSADDKRR